MLRTPGLTKACERLRAEGNTALADSIRLIDGPLRGPEAKRRDTAVLAALRDYAPAPVPSGPPSREELFDLARSGKPEDIRRALIRLGESQTTKQDQVEQDPDVADLLAELLTHPKPRVRLQAHRTARRLLDRPTYLQQTSILLSDPQPNVVALAIRSVSHAAWEPAIPAMVALLEHSHPLVRAEAAAGLIRMGAPAISALRRAADHARPDKRVVYTAVLTQIAAVFAPIAPTALTSDPPA